MGLGKRFLHPIMICCSLRRVFYCNLFKQSLQMLTILFAKHDYATKVAALTEEKVCYIYHYWKTCSFISNYDFIAHYRKIAEWYQGKYLIILVLHECKCPFAGTWRKLPPEIDEREGMCYFTLKSSRCWLFYQEQYHDLYQAWKNSSEMLRANYSQLQQEVERIQVRRTFVYQSEHCAN